MRKTIILCALLLASAQTVCAQKHNVKVMTLQDCLAKGLEKNFSIRMVRNREEVSSNNATAANAGLLPEVSLAASYGTDLHTTRSTARQTGTVSEEKNAFDQTLDAGIELNWTIFDGFNVWTNYKQLQMMKQQGELQTRVAVEDYVASLTAEYYNYIQQSIRLKNFRNAMRLSRERLRIVEVNYHVGSFSQLEYLQAKVDFNADSTQYMKQREALTTSRIRLNQLLANDDVTAPVGIRDTTIDVNPNLDYDHLWQATLSANSSLLLADKNTEIVKADYKMVMSRDYPYVRLNLGYGYTQNRYELAATRKRDNWGLNAGVTVGFRLFDGKRRMQKRNAELDIKYAELERDNLTLSLKSELNNFWQAYKNNWEILQKERQNLIAAETNYEFANLKYLEHSISGFEMREAQQSLLDARERILVAEYDTKMCEISLLQLSGKVTDYLAGEATTTLGD